MGFANSRAQSSVAEGPFATVTAAFHHHAKTSPASIAVRELSESPQELTYQQLFQRAQLLAQRRRDEGVLPGQRIPFVTARGVDMIIGIWAILFSGAQYVPLDEAVVSDETIGRVLKVTQASFVLCLGTTEPRVSKLQLSSAAIVLEREGPKTSERADGEVVDFAISGGGCYTAYASDVNGLSMAVDVTQRNVANLVCSSPGDLGIRPGTCVGQMLDITVDIAAWEIFACHCNGGTLVLRGPSWEPALGEIDVLICTPTILSKYHPEQFPRLSTVAAVGESTSKGLADLWATHATYWDCWGSTETTVVNTMRKHGFGSEVTIGKPIPNNKVYMLDLKQHVAPDGETGVAWVGGHGVARGYVGSHGEAAARRYRSDPFANDGSQMFNTRQFGRRRGDGTIEILGQLGREVEATGSLVASKSELKPQISLSSLTTIAEKCDLTQELPDKGLAQPFRGFKYRIFIAYRTLFSLVGLLNIVALVSVLALKPASQWLGTITAMNLTMAVLVRQDSVVNMLYTISCSIPKKMPLWVRIRFANIYHLGGVHSGAGVCATAWLIISTIKSTVSTATYYRDEQSSSMATQVISWLLCGLCCGMVGVAWPSIRKNNHNFFERFHRFAGWTTLGLFWVRIILVINDSRPKGQPFGLAMAKTADFWLLMAVTCSIASSWLYLRKVPVEAEVLSDHAVRLHFDYAIPVNGSFTRVSQRPLIEWHSFASIAAPEPTNHARGYSMIVSNAGDWTRSCIEKPPTSIWVRGLPTCGVMRIAPLFNRIVIIATGSGIGPMLGHITHPPCPLQLIWSAPRPEVTFGKEIVDTIRGKLPDAVIHDTKTYGRPDLVRMGFNLAQSFGAEAVLIIANERITKKVVYGIESRGIPAFGAIWDS